MLEINLETFLKELNNRNTKQPIKMLLRGFCSTNYKSMIIIFDNICYHLTDKIHKINHKEFKEISASYGLRRPVNRGDNNWKTFIDFMNTNFNLCDYPEMII